MGSYWLLFLNQFIDHEAQRARKLRDSPGRRSAARCERKSIFF